VPTKRILMGADPTKVVSRDSLANPEALDYFVELADRGKERLYRHACLIYPGPSSLAKDRDHC
jgi:hypothetical protein